MKIKDILFKNRTEDVNDIDKPSNIEAPIKSGPLSNENTKKATKHWDSHGKNPPKQWLHNSYVARAVLLDPLNWHGGCWFNWLQRKYFETPAENALSLCCGSGRHERRMAHVNIAEKITGMDISEGQLGRAREAASKEGYQNVIEYKQENIQKAILPENKYDFVIVVAGLHHLINLPHVFEQIHRTLKPEGVLVISEYVGPDHMDYSSWERELFQRALLTINPDYRVRKSTGNLLERAGQQTREQAIARDPSEGVNSSKIMTNLRKFFDIDVEIEMGNSILRECLYDIVDNFSEEKDEDKKALDNLIHLERTLRKNGLIENHHVFGVYKPRIFECDS